MFDKAPEDFHIQVRGVWIPTAEEVADLEEPNTSAGNRWLYYVVDRGPEVRILLGTKDEPNPFKADVPFFADTYTEVRRDGKRLRRTVRLYPDTKGVYRQEVVDGKHSIMDLDFLERELSAFEVKRKIYIREGLVRPIYDEEGLQLPDKDSIMPVPDGHGYLIRVAGEERLARNMEDACKLADYMTHIKPEVDFGDWTLTKKDKRF